jgi:hypothetical protein
MYIALILPYYIFIKKTSIKLDIKELNQIGLLFMIIGAVSTLAGNFIPNSLRFVFYLLQNLLYVGAGIILFQQNASHKKWAFLAILWLVYSAISRGLFHDLILWLMFLFFILAIKIKINIYQTLIFFFIGLLSLSIIQSIKDDFRTQLAKSNSPIELFTNLALANLEEGSDKSEEEVNDLNVRLNQGWIISAIIKHVPKKEPYANGATVKKAIWASLLPRFLNPDKKRAGGRENFSKYTGLNIRKNTSMGMSIIGEAYANYGKNGGILFMLLWGGFLTLFWNFLMQIAEKKKIVLFILPLIFLQAVKAETELVVVLNHLVKSSIICYVLIWYLESNSKKLTT